MYLGTYLLKANAYWIYVEIFSKMQLCKDNNNKVAGNVTFDGPALCCSGLIYKDKIYRKL